MGTKEIRARIRIGDRMRPKFDFNNINEIPSKTISYVFECIAKPEHYKTQYTIMRDKKVLNINGALKELFKDTTLIALANSYCDDDANYQLCLASALRSGEYDKTIQLPIRDCDFKTLKSGTESWVWIEERIEVIKNVSDYSAYELFVDEKKNILLWLDYDEDSYYYYREDSEMGIAYKGWLAEQQLLGD